MPDSPAPDLVPRSELLRVAEVIRTEERRKRFCLQVALAVAVVLVFVLIVGMVVIAVQAISAGMNQMDSELERSRSALALQQQRNQEALTALLEQCEAALRAGDTERADWALNEAERRLAEGGAEQLKGRVTRCRTDLTMLQELDRIDNARWAALAGPPIAPMPREVKRP